MSENKKSELGKKEEIYVRRIQSGGFLFFCLDCVTDTFAFFPPFLSFGVVVFCRVVTDLVFSFFFLLLFLEKSSKTALSELVAEGRTGDF